MRIACAGGQVPIDFTLEDDTEMDGPPVYLNHAYKSKVERSISDLNPIRETDPDSKTLIFSQFKYTLKLLRLLWRVASEATRQALWRTRLTSCLA
mmetsp:Transcript_4867/g.9999  ORF Transcript_4867/g.9999 Transcript_4867/m.9999 type:complete len:95 (+) Transcript_4867:422-706(+)